MPFTQFTLSDNLSKTSMGIFQTHIPNTEMRLSLSEQVTYIAIGNLTSISVTHSFSVREYRNK